jgi:hypothetical protein
MSLTYNEQKALDAMTQEVETMDWNGVTAQSLYKVAVELKVFQHQQYCTVGRVVLRFNAILHKMRSGQIAFNLVTIVNELDSLKNALPDSQQVTAETSSPVRKAAGY